MSTKRDPQTVYLYAREGHTHGDLGRRFGISTTAVRRMLTQDEALRAAWQRGQQQHARIAGPGSGQKAPRA